MEGRIIYVICVAVIVVFCLMMNRIKKWKEKSALAFFIIGQRAHTGAERKWGYCNALRAGNRKAEKFYVYSALSDFMAENPMMPFNVKLPDGSKVPLVFVDYYIPKRDWNFISSEQRKFVQRVYDFKDGKDPCSGFFKDAISKLELKKDVTVMFMPCSSQQKYFNRFSRLSKALSYIDGLHPMLYSHIYLEERECRHKSRERDKVLSDSNIVLNSNIIGKDVLLVDDVITTGNSIKEHTAELNKYGAKVVGVVCLAKTVRYPSSLNIWWVSHAEK